MKYFVVNQNKKAYHFPQSMVYFVFDAFPINLCINVIISNQFVLTAEFERIEDLEKYESNILDFLESNSKVPWNFNLDDGFWKTI